MGGYTTLAVRTPEWTCQLLQLTFQMRIFPNTSENEL